MKKVIGILFVTLLSVWQGVIAQPESPISPAMGEIQLSKSTLKKMSILLKGSEREQKVLEQLRQMVEDILDNTEFAHEKTPATPETLATKNGLQEWDIIISADPPEAPHHPYKISLVLKKAGIESQPRFFEYSPHDRSVIQQQLKAFLTQELNLTAKRNLAPTQEKNMLSSLVTVGKVETVPSEATSLTTTEQPAVQLQSTKAEPEKVDPEREIQLRKLTPTVKSINIKLEGTSEEQGILNELQHMVNNILNSSKLEVLSVPVNDEPSPSPAIKLYENLEIVIQVKLAETLEQPHQVSLTLQELGHLGKPVSFNYYPKERDSFYKELQIYLAESLNLSPRRAFQQ